MKKISIILLTVLSFTIFFTSTSFAQKRGYRKEVVKERIFEKLELTEAQQEEIGNLRYDHQMQAIDLRAELKKNRLELKNIFDRDEVNESTVMSIVEKNNSIHNKLAVMRAEILLKMNSILTPEQREKVKGLPIFDMGFGEGMGNGFGPGMRHGSGQGMGLGQGPDGGFRRGFDNDFRCRF